MLPNRCNKARVIGHLVRKPAGEISRYYEQKEQVFRLLFFLAIMGLLRYSMLIQPERMIIMKKIRIGIMGYGNLGRGVELAVRQNPDHAAKQPDRAGGERVFDALENGARASKQGESEQENVRAEPDISHLHKGLQIVVIHVEVFEPLDHLILHRDRAAEKDAFKHTDKNSW